MWNDAGFGFSMDGGPLVNHSIWADNTFLVASSAHQLGLMFDSISTNYYAAKLNWKATELRLGATSETALTRI